MKKTLRNALSIFVLSGIFLISLFASPISAKSNFSALYAKLGVNENMPYDTEMGLWLIKKPYIEIMK